MKATALQSRIRRFEPPMRREFLDEWFSPPRILVVEDERDVSLSLMKRLRHEGFEAIVVEDGFDGLFAADEEVPDAIILDIGIPGIDGHTVAEKLKSDRRTSEIPIIYLTARQSAADRERAHALGAHAFLTKPFASEALVEVVRSAVSLGS